MANPDHLKTIMDGVGAWNAWRRASDEGKCAESISDLSSASLSGKYLRNANFSGANLRGADLANANLNDSILVGADLRGANLTSANLINADLTEAMLDYAELRNSNLSRSILHNAHFFDTKLAGARFTGAMMGYTTIAATDLSKAKGLFSVKHTMPSTVGIDTLYYSNGEIPERFLRDAGLPVEVIEYLLPAIRIGPPIQWNSCFISYSTKDEQFAVRLHSRMRQAGLRVWFAPEDIKGGDYFFEQIERAIQSQDRLLLVLSEESIQSKWVEREIRRTRKIERTEKRRKLFPIRLVDMKTLREWECLDSDTGEDLAEEVRKYHIPDFSNWKNHDAFETAFARLEKDLRTSVCK